MIPAIAGFPARAAAGPTSLITIGVAGSYVGFQGSQGSASPTALVFPVGTRTLAAAFVQTDYSVPHAFRLIFNESYSQDPRNWFKSITVEGMGTLLASNAEWNAGGSGLVTWAGLPRGNWTTAGQQRRITFNL